MQSQNKQSKPLRIDRIILLVGVTVAAVAPKSYNIIYRAGEIGLGPFGISGFGAVIFTLLIITNSMSLIHPEKRNAFSIWIQVGFAACIGNLPAIVWCFIGFNRAPFHEWGDWIFFIGWTLFWWSYAGNWIRSLDPPGE